MSVAALKLPEGWTSEERSIGTVIAKPRADLAGFDGFVTISFERRGFALGIRTPHWDHPPAYTGRGWRDRLVAAAVAALTEASK